MMPSLWRTSKGVDNAWYIVLLALEGHQLSAYWGPFDSEPEASEVCAVRNRFAEKRRLARV